MNAALLDTDALSEVLKRRNPDVRANATAYLSQYGRFAFSGMTRYEIRRGYLSNKAIKPLERFDVLCERSIVLPINNEVLDTAATLWTEGRAWGRPHNDADLIIAATAIVHRLTLVTGNTDDFSWIAGLALEDWRKP